MWPCINSKQETAGVREEASKESEDVQVGAGHLHYPDTITHAFRVNTTQMFHVCLCPDISRRYPPVVLEAQGEEQEAAGQQDATGEQCPHHGAEHWGERASRELRRRLHTRTSKHL